MAVRREEFDGRGAVVYRFPATAAARARRARRREVLRHRLLVLAIVTVAVVAFLLATGPRGRAPASRSRAPASVVVRPGDSAWDIADRYAPEGVDTRAYVDALYEINGLEGTLPAGARIRLPN